MNNFLNINWFSFIPRLFILFKILKHVVSNNINGCISTGKEVTILKASYNLLT